MMKLSKKQRKLKKQQAIASKSKGKEKRAAHSKAFLDQTLTGMVIRKKNIFIPRAIDRELLTPAYANKDHKDNSQIIFKPAATLQLHKFIDWGTSSKRNTVEQQGILLGSVVKTPSGYSAVVEAVLLSNAIGNQVYVESAHSQWSEMDYQMDELNMSRKRKLVKIGWWHTHPNMNVFMSGTDRETQSNYFHKDWQFAVVLNPQECKWAAFVGENAEPCEGCFINHNIFRLKTLERHYID